MNYFPPPTPTPLRKAPAGRRVKPARGAKVASLVLSAVSTLGLAALFAKQDEAVSTLATTPSPSTTSGSTTVATIAGTTATTATTTVGTTAAAAPGIADGVFVGVADSNRWGTVQVQILVSGGLLTNVEVLSYPDSDRKSVRINESALPTLTAEALAAQDADIDSVSGATYTWQSYTISLQSALDAASFVV